MTAKANSLTNIIFSDLFPSENLGSFRVSAFCQAFASLISHPNSDIMLLACRAVTHLLDALPNVSSQIVNAGIVQQMV